MHTPDRGDVVNISLNPQKGREQRGHRPALVLTPAAYNGKSSLMLVVPITNKAKGYPFEVEIPPGLGVTGVALSDQVRSMDWRARHAEFRCTVPEEVIEDVLAKVQVLLDI